MKSKVLSIKIREKIFWTMLSVFVVSLGLYVHSLLSIINHVVVKESLVKSNNLLTQKVSELEFKNVALKNKINIEFAVARGFSEVKNALYVSRSSVSLTLNTEGR